MNPIIPQPPLLRAFADQEETLRREADQYRQAAAAEEAAADQIDADLTPHAERVRELLAEVERVRAVMEGERDRAARHRHRAAVFTRRADERLSQAVPALHQVIARAERLPVFAPQCGCGLPGAPDADQRRAACPVHADAEPEPAPGVLVADSGPTRTQPDVAAAGPGEPRHAKPKPKPRLGTGAFKAIVRREFGDEQDGDA